MNLYELYHDEVGKAVAAHMRSTGALFPCKPDEPLPPMKAEAAQPHWESEPVWSHDGRSVNVKTVRKAILKLYGPYVFERNIVPIRDDRGVCTPLRFVDLFDLNHYNATGEYKPIGAVIYETGGSL